MKKRAIQLPFSFIIFLIIIIIVVALLLVWNFSGFEILDKVFGSAGSAIQDSSGGVIDSLV